MLRESYNHWRVADDTIFITMLGGSQYMYLLEGQERALLVDTGWGCGQLRKYVERLTDKPVVVVNTHGHPDHVGGNGWWQEIHVHVDAVGDIANMPRPPSRYEPPHPDYAKIFVGEGFVFDLGGRKVEVIEISAHAAGSIALLDHEMRMLFTGDEIEAGQVLMFDFDPRGRHTLEQRAQKHLDNMLKLKAREAEFSFLCPAHNGSPIACSYIDDFVELDKQILEGIQRVEPRLCHPYIGRLPFAKELRRVRHGKVSMIYRVQS